MSAKYLRKAAVRSALLAALSLPMAASAQEYCTQESFLACLENGSIGYGTPATVSGVETIVELRDSNGDGKLDAQDASWQLYRKLIGPRYTMPATPRVRIILNDLRLGHEVPVVQDMGPVEYDSRYLEFGLQLLAQYGPHLGWRDVRLWLNNIAGFESGRGTDIAKFLSEMVYEQNPRRIEGYATSYAGPDGNSLVMRADWRPAPEAASIFLLEDPAQGRRTSDGTHDGDPWQGGVFLGQFGNLATVPYDWLIGQYPTENPTRQPVNVSTVYVRIQINPDFDTFNEHLPERQSIADADPLPDMFDEAAGESLATMIDIDQEVVGVQYGPFHTNLISEGAEITDDGPCAERANCEGGTYRESSKSGAGTPAQSVAPDNGAVGGSIGGLALLPLLLIGLRRRMPRA